MNVFTEAQNAILTKASNKYFWLWQLEEGWLRWRELGEPVPRLPTFTPSPTTYTTYDYSMRVWEPGTVSYHGVIYYKGIALGHGATCDAG